MSTTVTPTELTDVHDMVVVHRVFRRELLSLPALIRGVVHGDAARAAVVADHARLVLTGLQIHHTREDTVLWPLLHARASADELVGTMEAQHAAIHTALETANAQV